MDQINGKPTEVLTDMNGLHVKTHQMSLEDKESVKIPWRQDNVESVIVIPVSSPICGVIVIGQGRITYNNGTTCVTVVPPVIKQSTITCYAKVDNQSLCYLLGDVAGHLFMLFLEQDKKPDGSVVVEDLKVELLGQVSIPECIAYLDNDVIFVGSRVDDSQLIKLTTKADENGSHCVPIKTFTNFDMAFVDLMRQGQEQLVTCSGASKEDSLKITSQELSNINLPGIKGMWALKVGDGNFDNTLVLSFVAQTRVLVLNGKEVEEAKIAGFVLDEQTLYTGNITNDIIIQITPTLARLVSSDVKPVISEWEPENKKTISVVACNGTQVLCATENCLFYLEIDSNQIVSKGYTTLPQEVACLDVSLLDESMNQAKLVAVGLWTDTSVRLLTLPKLEEINIVLLGAEIIPRSILMTCYEGNTYLLCASGDGGLHYFTLDKKNGTLADKKEITLGTQPTVLRTFRSLSTTKVFACSDQLTVIYSADHKLALRNVNLKEVNHICSLNADSYPDSLALASDSTGNDN